MSDAPRPPLPPFTIATAALKVRAAEDAWNSRDPARVSLAYTAESVWRNRAEFFQGRDAIKPFLTGKWAKELDYRLIKELWTCGRNRIAVRFAYEWHDASNNWFRSYGNENWEFDDNGLMRRRIASINDLPIRGGPLAALVAGVRYAARLDEQHLHLALGVGFVLDASGNDEHLAGCDAHGAVAEIDP